MKRKPGRLGMWNSPIWHQNDNPKAMVESIMTAMKEYGADEDSLIKTRKLMKAKFGIGSWQDVIALHEETLKEQEEHNYIDGQLTTLIQLTEYAINDGDKERARQYVIKAEALLASITAVDIEESWLQPHSISGETLLQLRRAEIQRLHNWVFWTGLWPGKPTLPNSAWLWHN